MKKVVFLLLFALFLFFPQLVHADDKVSSAVNMNYAVSTSGNTHVTAKITLTNTTESFYVSSYSLKLGFPTVSNIVASDPSGPLIPVIKQSESGQEITLNFKSVVTGKGKSLPFTLSFDTPDIASENGTIWEVNIPGLSRQDDFTNFSVDLSVPASFGKATFIKPDVGSGVLHFTKAQLGKSGISVTFGNSQTYAYSLGYHLENTNLYPIRTEIALPPTTNYQQVSIRSLNPKPDGVTMDVDGNWLAMYHLAPKQKITVTADGLISVDLTPKEVALSDTERILYLKKQPYWQTDNQEIKKLAASLKTPEAIYEYVIQHLSYDFNRVKNEQIRVGAEEVLQKPSSAVCLEFTDLFIALSRAAGIPARSVEGFAYTQNTISRPLSLSKDILHAWPEYYDDNKHTWIMVDPTWGNTTGGVDYFHTLDFDHVAFVIKGESSAYPVPAGGYKFASEQDGKDVQVTVSQEHITDEPTVRIGLQTPKKVLAGFPLTATATFENTGTVLFPKQPMTITAQLLSPKQQFVAIPAIPPFGKTSVQFSFFKTPFLTNTTDTITITLSGKSLTDTISAVALTKHIIIGGGIIFVIFSTVIWLVAKRSRRVSIPR